MIDDGETKLDELLAKGGVDFVQSCYRALLNREPDEDGLRHHLDLLAKGAAKLPMVVDILNSPECAAKGLRHMPLAVAAQRRFRRRRGVIRNFFKGRGVGVGPVATPLTDAVEQPTEPPCQVVSLPLAVWLEKRRANSEGANAAPQLWFDLTTSIQWQHGVVGIIRAELEMARNLKRVRPSLRFSMQFNQGFVELLDSELEWLLNADNVVEAYMGFFGRNGGGARKITVEVPSTDGLFYPYGPKDTVFSMGWKDSQKERLFSAIKVENPHVSLGYLIYDIIMLRPETEHFYARQDKSDFEAYLKWVSYNCDFLLFGGENTKRDVEEWQRGRGWPVLPGRAIRFGSDIVKGTDKTSDHVHLEQLGVTGPFILAVGTVEPRKNYSTLYRAYLLAQELAGEPLPTLVICGQDGHRVQNLIDQMARDPRIEGKILRRSPSDEQLSALYNHCLFTLLPSFYEGWSLTLPESFAHGKFCLCADSPPLRETGGDFAEYVDPIDVMAWAKAVIHYTKNAEMRAVREAHIEERWNITTWADSAGLLSTSLDELQREDFSKSRALRAANRQPEIWMDLSLSYMNWNSSLSGVTRVELMYAKLLRKIVPSSHFFAHADGKFFEIDPSYLTWLDDNKDLSQSYNDFNAFWRHHEGQGLSFRNPLRNVSRAEQHPAYISAFPSGSIIFFAGIDFGIYDAGKPKLSYTHKVEAMRPKDGNSLLVHFMHDFTPSDWPQIHKSETVDGYEPFCDFVSNHFDYLVYGGVTAQQDGEALQRRRGWKVPVGDPVMLGFDIAEEKLRDSKGDAEYLDKLGIKGDFVLAVGTLEPRKNHETLYRAYLLMLQRSLLRKPLQMVFVGKTGWNNGDFLATLESDARLKGRVITANPTDEGLDILYRHSLFTLLPSFYEGWSLPLPESLAYGKFCLVSDTPPLRERGGKFVEFIHPLDAMAWAERIAFYANEPQRLVAWEEKIRREWRPVTWHEATTMLVSKLYDAYEKMLARAPVVRRAEREEA